MENISFSKMSGAGNDFIVFNEIPGVLPEPVLLKKMCDRRNGIGADGVIIISGDSSADFRMQYYNADGYPGTLCGNGARCAIKYAHYNGLLKGDETKFISGSKEYSGKVLDENSIRFNLLPPEGIERNRTIKLGSKDVRISFADTGSPHVVIFAEEISDYFGTRYSLEEIPVEGLGREIRYHGAFSPGGVNVNFIAAEEGRLKIRTYERGVENETLACGTGSVAAAVIAFLEERVEPPVSLITRSGEELIVNFNFRNNKFSDVSLTGAARIIFTGEYRI
jgi:diaminopimelate epimerase